MEVDESLDERIRIAKSLDIGEESGTG